MALRLRLLLCLFMCLLPAIAFAQRPPSPVSVTLSDDCYRTATGVPQWCEQEFIRALFTGNSISDCCCLLLSCVHEASCASVLRGFCVPPEANQCAPPPPSLLPSVTPVSAGTTN